MWNKFKNLFFKDLPDRAVVRKGLRKYVTVHPRMSRCVKVRIARLYANEHKSIKQIKQQLNDLPSVTQKSIVRAIRFFENYR